MKNTMIAAFACACALGVGVTVSEAKSGAQNASARYTNLTCKQKIDPKNLTGQAKKDAWKACRESPDTYN